MVNRVRLIDADALTMELITILEGELDEPHKYCYPCKEILTAVKDAPTIEERKTEKALRLLLKWAIECDFGYDNIPEEYEKYKDDIEGMSYTDGLIYIAKMEVEHEAD